MMMTNYIDPLGKAVVWTAARQHMLALLKGFCVLSKDTSTCSKEEPGIEPPTWGFVDYSHLTKCSTFKG